MSPDTICKTVHQYNSAPVSAENMKKLQEIADDYGKVKNYVYQRYGGVRSLAKLYPGFTVQNEMIASGLRDELGLPFVYFNLAVFDALKDIRSRWTATRDAIAQRVGLREDFSEEEKHYLRYLLKVNNAFESVVNNRPVELTAELQKQYDLLAGCVDTRKLNHYLQRQVRRLHGKLHTNRHECFSLTERAYRYGDHGIYITTKEKRKRTFIPLTDNNRYVRQITVKLLPERNGLEIGVPVEQRVRKYQDYMARVGVALGMQVMLMTDEGHSYGEKLGEYQTELACWLRRQAIGYHPGNEAEAGRKKYMAKKRRLAQRLHSYINMELNRFLKTEKPQQVCLPRLPRPQKHRGNRAVNHAMNLWQRGYIRARLRQKCQEQSVEIVEVFSKDIGRECSRCGAMGNRREGIFFCKACGYQAVIGQNTARNVKKRGETEGIMGTAVRMNEGDEP